MALRRTIFNDEHELYRDMVRQFMSKEVAPTYASWEEHGSAPRSFWRRAGELGLLSAQIPEEYGGAGHDSFKFNAITIEEAESAGVFPGAIRLHTDICLPYFLRYATEEQKARWLPPLADGAKIVAIAMSEPGAGSDLRAIRTRARRDGDHYTVSGSKVFISNGSIADLIIVVVRTADGRGDDVLSLLVGDGAATGLRRTRITNKIGMKSQDLAELAFEDVRIPVENLLGEEGHGFRYLTANLAQERLSIGLNSLASATAALERTIEYVRQRTIFERPVASFQNTKFTLADCSTEIEAGRAFADSALQAHDDGTLTAADAARLKLYCTETQGRVVDRCLQLHGAYGYLRDYPIARAYVDARATRIYGGSSEVMRLLIARSLSL
jgi:acyl-CoA dehydrogenase